ncbi:MAG: tetratricopeptide repeat protein, partial [Rhodothermales bacterium]|nr:tetratricopeptide repeat protein [Rhodothermales bacterium]
MQIRRHITILLGILALPMVGCAQDAGLSEGITLLQNGSYSDARGVLRSIVGSPADSTGEATVGYLETFLATGDYPEGLTAANGLLEEYPDSPYVHYMLGRLLYSTGQIARADSTFRRAAALKRNYWRNALALGELFHESGKQRQANQIFATIRNAYKQGYFRTSQTLSVAARSAAFVEEFRDANNAYNKANQLDPNNTQNLIWWADLFREKYNDADAERTYQDALSINENLSDAWIGLARTVGSFAAKEEYVERALAVNPNSSSALAIRASLRLLDGQYEVAAQILDQALQSNPASLELLAHLAAVYHLKEDSTSFAETEQRA